MSTTTNTPQVPGIPEHSPDILPTLFGEGYGEYQVKPVNFLLSFVLHCVGMAVILTSGLWIVQNKDEIKQQVIEVLNSAEVSPYILPTSPNESGGGGGGGDGDVLEASRGGLPKQSHDMQMAPPMVIKRNDNPKLPVQESVVAPQISIPSEQLGDPMSKVLGALSNGTGTGGGIGTGSGGGVGSGRGPGVGPGTGGGTGGGVYRVGGGVSEPRALYTPDPEYSEEARKSKYQGTVILWVIVGPDGRPHDIRVQRSLGMGLDEKALEAVKQWRFEPAKLNGQPVAVQINVEVNFRLY